LVKPWRGNALVAVDARLLYRLVESYYGGASRVRQTAPRFTLSATEERINRILVDTLTSHFARAFQPVAEIELEHLRCESSPSYVSIATAGEAAVVIRLEITVGEAGGASCLVLPLSLLEPVRERLDEELRSGSAESRARWSECMRGHLVEATVELRGRFLETSISLKELLRMKTGDVLPIEVPQSATLHAGGVALL